MRQAPSTILIIKIVFIDYFNNIFFPYLADGGAGWGVGSM